MSRMFISNSRLPIAINRVSHAPRITISTALIPIFKVMLRTIPFLNKNIFDRLLNTWNTAVIASTFLKSKKEKPAE